MNNVEICQYELLHPNGRKDRMAILSCGPKVENPKAVMDDAVSKYVVNDLYNEFIEIHLDNPWHRIVISGINELYYKPFKPAIFKDVEFFDQTLISKNALNNGIIAILRGGLHSDKPIAYMNAAVSEYVGQNMYNEFIEINLDNPWVRVILTDLNSIDYELFKKQTINGSI